MQQQDPRKSRSSYQTYRLKEIAQEWDKAGVQQQLCKLLSIDPQDVEVRSLARDPLEPHKQIATLALSSVPERLRVSRTCDEWVIIGFNTICDVQTQRTPPDATLDVHFHGFTPLHCTADRDCDVDLVALSGLNGHAFGSFKERGGSFMWLRDALPEGLPRTRIYIYGYDTSLPGSLSQQTLLDLGILFAEALKCLSKQSTGQKLLLLGHSLGGLVLQSASSYITGHRLQFLTEEQAMISLFQELQSGNPTESLDVLKYAFYGTVLFGVPQLGLSSIEALRGMVTGQPNEDFVRALRSDSELLRLLSRNFNSLRRNIANLRVVCFYETRETKTPAQSNGAWGMTGPTLLLVSRQSATLGSDKQMPINRDHSEIVKFSRGDQYYQLVLQNLRALVTEQQAISKGPSVGEMKALHSLAFPGQDSRQNNIFPEPETCAWLTEHELFQTWLWRATTATERLLWVRGRPGSGKSTCMKHALDLLSIEMSHCVIASFFFHGRGTELQRTKLGFARAMLNQLLVQLIDERKHFTSLYEERSKGQGDMNVTWTEGELLQLLVQYVTDGSRTRQVILVVDALDESGQEAAQELVSLLQRLVRVTGKSASFARILFSCRDYPVLPERDRLIIRMETGNETDINRVVKLSLQETFDAQDVTTLEHEIITKASNMFQWAVLVTKLAESRSWAGDSLSMILERIRILPETLNELYRDLLQRPSTQTIKLFQWILFSIRPLSLDEFHHALASDQDMHYRNLSEFKMNKNYLGNARNGIIDLSKGLAEIRKNGNDEVVQVIHQSVLDYLVQEGGMAKMFIEQSGSAIIADAHFQISRSCLRYL